MVELELMCLLKYEYSVIMMFANLALGFLQPQFISYNNYITFTFFVTVYGELIV